MSYVKATSIPEACSLVAAHKGEGRVVAGGTDLLVQMKAGKNVPRHVIDISEIAGNDFIDYDVKAGLRIGAQAKVQAIADSKQVKDKFSLLAEAAANLGTPQVRNMATMAGNMCNASPSAETLPSLIVLGATAKVVRIGGERMVPVEEFVTGPGRTVLASDEIVTEFVIPNPPANSGGVYFAHKVRKVQDLAAVNVAVLAVVQGDVIKDIKIALGAVAPTPFRAKRSEKTLKGSKLTDALLEIAAGLAVDDSSPIDDVRCSAQYRREIIRILVKRAVTEAVQRARGTR